MIRVNLLPARVSRRFEAVRNEINIALFLAMLIAIGAAAFHMVVVGVETEDETFVRTWESKVSKSSETEERLTNLRRQRDGQEERRNIIRYLKAMKTGPVRMLDEIAKAAPDQMRLLSISENRGQVELVGRATSNDVIADFAQELDSSPFFEEVYINTSEVAMEEGVRVKEFTVAARLVVVTTRTN